MAATVEPARDADAAEIYALLRENRLPLEGLAGHLPTTLVARQEGHIVGTAGLEVYDRGVLLRSVAVAASARGQGLGRDLTRAAIQLARDIGSPSIYLLTTTAEDYFPRFGFERIQRADVPSSVQASVEFTSACPAGAVVMRLTL